MKAPEREPEGAAEVLQGERSRDGKAGEQSAGAVGASERAASSGCPASRGLPPTALTTALPKCGATLMVGLLTYSSGTRDVEKHPLGSRCLHGSEGKPENIPLAQDTTTPQLRL